MHVKSPLLSNVGIRLGACTALLGSLMDQEESKLPNNQLYAEGWSMILFNLLFLGPFVYQRIHCASVIRGKGKKNFDFLRITIIHSSMYMIVHRLMHKVKAFRGMHSAHHKYKTEVVPSISNAVSPSEFLCAYMMPFIVAAHIVKPSETALVLSASVISLFNLIVHSNQNINLPEFMVHPKDHLEHHLTRKPVYSAPTIHWERLFNN